MRHRFTQVAQRGIALVSAIAFLAVTALFIGTALLVGVSDRQRSADNVRTLKAQFAAEAGVERVVYESWYGSLDGAVPAAFAPDLKSFREGLDTLELVNTPDDTDGAAGLPAGDKVAGDYVFGAPRLFAASLQDGLSYQVSVRRADVGGEKTVLRVDATGWQGNANDPASVRRVTEDLVIAPESGPDYALLTDNANCLFCHTTVTSLEAAYGGSDRYEDTKRIKVGGLRSLDTDRAEALESLVAGTVYTRNDSNLLGSSTTLRGIEFETHRGRRTNRLSGAGATPFTGLPTYDCATACSDPYGSFYKNYPATLYPDAELPDTFPLPVEDSDGDRLISHDEWQQAVAAELEPGTLSGGARKELYATSHDADNKTALDAQRTATVVTDDTLTNGLNGVAGNLVLEGSEASPLIVEGTLYVDGDLLIRGPVTGDGKLVVRGNVYIAGDVTYACDENSRDDAWGSRSACKYDEPDALPRFGLIAGKNILVGAYQTPYVSSFWESNPGAGLVRPSDQLTRTEFSAVSADELTRWYLDPGKDEGLIGLSAGGDYSAGGPYNQAGDYRVSFTTGQMMLFNQQEYLRSSEPGYTPRYYRMRPGSPVYRCELDRGGVVGAGCSSYTEATPFTPDADAAIVSLTPTDSWLTGTDTYATPADAEETSELTVRKAWIEGVENNSARGTQALQIDGLLYSAHGLFALNPTMSQTAGSMVLNGALVAADTGLLMPGTAGLNIHYDKRLRPLMKLKQDPVLVQQRTGYRLLNADETITYEGLTP